MSDFQAKMHQIRFRLGSAPDPRWGSLGCEFILNTCYLVSKSVKK